MKEEAIFLLDNAKCKLSFHHHLCLYPVDHVSSSARASFQALGIKVCFTAAYSYDSSSVELLFAGLKQSRFMDHSIGKGKKYVN